MKKARQRRAKTTNSDADCAAEALATMGPNTKRAKNWKLPHLVWREGRWLEAAAVPQPVIKIKYRLAIDDYRALGIPVVRKPWVVTTTEAMGDTGCSSMIARTQFTKDLGLCKRETCCQWTRR